MKKVQLNFALMFMVIQFFLVNIRICIVVKNMVIHLKEIKNVHQKIVRIMVLLVVVDQEGNITICLFIFFLYCI